MTVHPPLSISPHITSLLRGTKLHDISFVDYPPAKWSWHLAMAMTQSILDPNTKQYWLSQPDKTFQELGTWLGQTWSRRSKTNLTKFPDIFPHAVALFETMMLRSQPALLRLYGNEGSKIGHYISHGLMVEGIAQYPDWIQSYYDMRQSIETDETLQNHVNENVSEYPIGWTKAKEATYRSNAEMTWPLLPVHAPMESSIEWFNPANRTITPIRTVINSHSSEFEAADNIDGVPYEALKFSKRGTVELTGLLGQHHEVGYLFNLSFNAFPVAGSRALHAHVVIEQSSELTDVPSLQQLHAMTLANVITKSLNSWLQSALVKAQTSITKFEPSVFVECELRDPAANLVWLDTVQEHMQQFMHETFNLPTLESTIRRTL